MIFAFFWKLGGSKSTRGIRVGSFDPDDPNSNSNQMSVAAGNQTSLTQQQQQPQQQQQHQQQHQQYYNAATTIATAAASTAESAANSTINLITSMTSKTLGNQRKFIPGGQRVSTISQNYNEKTMLLSSDDEYQ